MKGFPSRINSRLTTLVIIESKREADGEGATEKRKSQDGNSGIHPAKKAPDESEAFFYIYRFAAYLAGEKSTRPKPYFECWEAWVFG